MNENVFKECNSYEIFLLLHPSSAIRMKAYKDTLFLKLNNFFLLHYMTMCSESALKNRISWPEINNHI